MNANLRTIVPALLLLTASVRAETEGVGITLLPSVSSIAAGSHFTVGLKIHHQPGYHTYWRNPGAVGVPTEIEWTLPEGFGAGPIRWPVPEHSKMAGYPVFGYESDVVLLIDLTAPDKLAADEVVIQATASWMACSDECHPGEKTFTLKLPVGPSTVAAHTELFREAEGRVPKPLDAWSARVLSGAHEETLRLELTPPADFPIPADLDVFSCDGQISSDPPTTIIRTDNGKLRLTAPRAEFGPEASATVPILLVSKSPLNREGQCFGTLEPGYPSTVGPD